MGIGSRDRISHIYGSPCRQKKSKTFLSSPTTRVAFVFGPYILAQQEVQSPDRQDQLLHGPCRRYREFCDLLFGRRKSKVTDGNSSIGHSLNVSSPR
jgi:hypothetical protein